MIARASMKKIDRHSSLASGMRSVWPAFDTNRANAVLPYLGFRFYDLGFRIYNSSAGCTRTMSTRQHAVVKPKRKT